MSSRPRTFHRSLGPSVAKVAFIVGPSGSGGYFADAVGLPLYIESDTLPGLRRDVGILVRNHFGIERPFELLMSDTQARLARG